MQLKEILELQLNIIDCGEEKNHILLKWPQQLKDLCALFQVEPKEGDAIKDIKRKIVRAYEEIKRWAGNPFTDEATEKKWIKILEVIDYAEMSKRDLLNMYNCITFKYLGDYRLETMFGEEDRYLIKNTEQYKFDILEPGESFEGEFVFYEGAIIKAKNIKPIAKEELEQELKFDEI